MTNHPRLAAIGLAAALAACGKSSTTSPGLLLNEPGDVAVFRGVTTKDPGNNRHPYLAVANSGANELTLVDALDDSFVPAPVPLRSLVIPIPGRPVLVASAGFGDGGADLLVAVSAGGSELQVVRTWNTQSDIAGTVGPLGGDVLALAGLASPASGTARVAAALSGGRLAVVTFGRSGDGGVDVAGATKAEAALGFQPVAITAAPWDANQLWAATLDELSGGVHGVAGIRVDDVISGVNPLPVQVLDALAPTRLVAAAQLAERAPGTAVVYQASGVDSSALVSAFGGQPVVNRVYAVLDESGCGLDAPIACGLVALDPGSGGLAPDPWTASTVNAPFRAPIAVPGSALALAAAPPPEKAPSGSAADAIFAGTYMRIASNLGARATTAAAAVASTDGALYYVDLGRWEIPSEQVVNQNVGATVTAARGTTSSGASVDQWLVLESGGSTVSHLDPTGLSSAVTVTPGYTPSVSWTVTFEGVLPQLSTRRAQAGNDGAPWLALQAGSAGALTDVVRLYDPTLGVRPGDTIVIDGSSLSACAASFEVQVADLVPPASAFPGGAVHLTEKDSTNAQWHSCFAALAGIPQGSTVAGLRATFRAGGSSPYVLVRGTGAAAIQVGRPALGERFEVVWSDETGFGACALPPLVAWPTSGSVPACDDACRSACEGLLRARLARRESYVPESCGGDSTCLSRFGGEVTDIFGPALGFTLALETDPAVVPPPRDLTLTIATRGGRSPLRAIDPAGAGVDARAVVPFDRSVDVPADGVRFLVPYANGVILDGTPTVHGGFKAVR